MVRVDTTYGDGRGVVGECEERKVRKRAEKKLFRRGIDTLDNFCMGIYDKIDGIFRRNRNI